MGWFSQKKDNLVPPLQPEQPAMPEPPVAVEPPAHDDLALMPSFDDVFASAPRSAPPAEPLSLQGLLPKDVAPAVFAPARQEAWSGTQMNRPQQPMLQQPSQPLQQPLPPPQPIQARPVQQPMPQQSEPKPAPQPVLPPAPAIAQPPLPQPLPVPQPLIMGPAIPAAPAPQPALPTPEDLLKQRRELRTSAMTVPMAHESSPYVEGEQYLRLLDALESIRSGTAGALRDQQMQLAAIDHADAQVRQIVSQLGAMWEDILVIEEGLSGSKR